VILALVLAATIQSQSPVLPVPVAVGIPEYPEAAVKARITGLVEVTLSVSPDGTVANAVADVASPPLINVAAVRAAREWRFQASDLSSQRPYVVRFEFSVDDTPAANDERCYVGPSSAIVLLPLQTVRIRGWKRSAHTTVSASPNASNRP